MSVVLYCGDPHGEFRHIVRAAEEFKALAVVLVGDLEALRPLHEEVKPIASKVWFIHGNHDTDSDANWSNVWESGLADRKRSSLSLHGPRPMKVLTFLSSQLATSNKWPKRKGPRFAVVAQWTDAKHCISPEGGNRPGCAQGGAKRDRQAQNVSLDAPRRDCCAQAQNADTGARTSALEQVKFDVSASRR